MATESMAKGRIVETRIPARLDRLPWARWHWLVLAGLGTVWILDGLEVTIVGAVGSTLTKAHSGISISTAQIGDAAGGYVAGACLGALGFGYLTDKLGRKKLFLVTLGVYLVATVLTGISTNAWMFFAFRFFTGMGIGGEYAAINSAIDELIPARLRGTVDLVVNGSFWLGTAVGAAPSIPMLDTSPPPARLGWRVMFGVGALLGLGIPFVRRLGAGRPRRRLIHGRESTAVGAALSIPMLDTSLPPAWLGWRIMFGIGALLGIGILFVRRMVPESPRWLFIHGREREAEAVVGEIEAQVAAQTGERIDRPV